MATGCNCPLWIACSWSSNVYVATKPRKISHIINKLVIRQALKHASLNKNGIGLFEINETFSTTFLNPLNLYFFISLLFPFHAKLIIVQFLMQMCVHISGRWPNGGILGGGSCKWTTLWVRSRTNKHSWWCNVLGTSNWTIGNFLWNRNHCKI